ncbi:hypothetical protein [Planctomicrobium piriforme]|uniref:Transglutaminase-like superfamily protein n=1 Tax=Planctomicrobium piriforme TaxID=1576369 RepID=A0A1I3BI98_9PLAN|nr:hypothetical protein [Planctomicrobium piriforme]SFH61993.1 hypothetical protein SAMN05421753_101470 [Planctomicrobium piriforme]
MQKFSSPRSGSLAVRVLGSLVLLTAVALLFLYALPKPVEKSDGAENTSLPADDINRQCEEELAVLLEALAPGRLGISSDRVAMVNRLNGWQAECGSVMAGPKAGDEIEVAKRLLSGETLARTLNDRFLPEDASHVRNSLLSRDIVAKVTEGKPNNVDRYVALFQFVCRNQMLIPPDLLKDLPFTPYEGLVFGMGSPEHRAWTFCDLLRQMRVDAVIITPKSESLAGQWLVGVIDPREGVLLFDPRLGMPIPAPSQGADQPQSDLPATLVQVLASDEPFRQLDLPDSPYPMKSEDLKNVSIQLIGNSCSWAPRMARLQFLLPSKFSTELYDGLGASELRTPGLVQRVTEAGASGLWKAEDVAVWNFPEQQLIAFEATRGQGTPGSPLANFLYIFQGPYIPQAVDDKGKATLVPVEKSLHFVRIEQLRGEQTAAMKDFLPIRSAAKLAPSKANELAAEYAALWTGVAQYETRKFPAAFATLMRFVSGQATSTGLVRAGVEWGAECLVAEKEYAAAIKLLKQAPKGLEPRRDALLIQRWEKMGGVKATPDAAPEKTTEKPVEPKPETAPPAEKMPAPTEPKTSEKKPAEMPAEKPAATPMTPAPAGESPAQPPSPELPEPVKEPAAAPAPAL